MRVGEAGLACPDPEDKSAVGESLSQVPDLLPSDFDGFVWSMKPVPADSHEQPANADALSVTSPTADTTAALLPLAEAMSALFVQRTKGFCAVTRTVRPSKKQPRIPGTCVTCMQCPLSFLCISFHRTFSSRPTATLCQPFAIRSSK